jgi:hypothetical protein
VRGTCIGRASTFAGIADRVVAPVIDLLAV